MSIVKIGDLHVALYMHTEQDPPMDQWEEALGRIGQLIESTPNVRLRGLVLSDGGAPNKLQRAQMKKTVSVMSKLSVVTTVLSNPIKRGIATVLRLVSPGYAFYRPEDFSAAMAHLDLPADALDAILAEYARMQMQLKPVRTLEMIQAQVPESEGNRELAG